MAAIYSIEYDRSGFIRISPANGAGGYTRMVGWLRMPIAGKPTNFPFEAPCFFGNMQGTFEQIGEDLGISVELIRATMVLDSKLTFACQWNFRNQLRVLHREHGYIGTIHLQLNPEFGDFRAVSPFTGGVRGQYFATIAASLGWLEEAAELSELIQEAA